MLTPSENGTAPDCAETTLYLVRHGQTEYNRKGIMQGRRIDSVLNATGRKQAEALARRFEDVPLDALYASTMRRARQTVHAIAERHPALDVHYDEDLEEMSWGHLEGKPATDGVLERCNEIKVAWRDGHFDRAVKGGESVRDVQTRALRAVRRILKTEDAGSTILVVAHGRFLRILIASLLEEEYGLENMHRVEHDNTGVNHLAWDAESVCTARVLNCTAHLDTVEGMLVE